MVTLNPSWTENVNLHTSAALAAAATATDDIDLDTLGADQANVTIEIVFGASVDGDTVVNIFASSNSGTDDDTIPIASITIVAVNDATVRRTIAVIGHPYIAVAVTNNDTTDNVTYEAWFAWREWVST